ncbi:hypothetical protein K5D56_05255 [Pseudomonas cichorii]|nr:hypothetical protein [Pseudomonas cichorii]MBX8568438.1 hypothetical protein [Pseudomonas cichorii]MBX8588777.1 hypothetical protein [Pseudomonas cichorii]
MSEPLLTTGSYVVQKSHALESSPLDMAIAGMEGAATKFSADAISDANVRTSYMNNIKRMSIETKAEVMAGKITAREGVEFCQEMRNRIMQEHRKFTSAQALAYAERKKRLPPTLQETLDKYALRIENLEYEKLTAEQKNKVHYSILESSGRDNAAVTHGTQKMKIMGKVGLLITATFAVYEIMNADNHVKEAARQGMIIGGGAAGGGLAGLTVSALCGPGAPVCAVAIVLAGTIVGGIAASLAADSLDEELEEFSKWEVL